MFRSRRGSPAVEFVLLTPVMIILLTGAYDIAQLLIAQSRVISAAQQIVMIATELSVQPDQSISLTANQGYQAQTAIYGLMPQLKSNSNTNAFSVTLSAVVFTATPPGCVSGVNCTYVANTAWSNAMPQSTTPVTRPCGVIAQVMPTTRVTIGNLPTAGMTALTSIVVADVSYSYVPLFGSFITGPVLVRRTAFLPPRTGSAAAYVKYNEANAAKDPSVCPGYL